MKTIKIREATTTQIDWLVAREEGYDCQFDDEVSGPWLVPQEGYLHDEKPLRQFKPSTDAAQGMPILEREKIDLRWTGEDWIAGKLVGWVHGPTMLIAGLRCFLASKLGDTVEIPEELL